MSYDFVSVNFTLEQALKMQVKIRPGQALSVPGG
jgi:hypothetical protein